MTPNSNTIRIFMIPLTSPCGPQATCCGPIGQSEEEIQDLKSAIEKEIGCQIEVLNVIRDIQIGDYPKIDQFVSLVGPMALPIITLDDKVVSLGNPTPEEAVSAIREKMNQM